MISANIYRIFSALAMYVQGISKVSKETIYTIVSYRCDVNVSYSKLLIKKKFLLIGKINEQLLSS
jgi:hypothetical protein